MAAPHFCSSQNDSEISQRKMKDECFESYSNYTHMLKLHISRLDVTHKVIGVMTGKQALYLITI